jgi:molybdate transport system substrate-binding protein
MVRLGAVLVVCAVAAAACGDDRGGGLTVFAAASLTEPFSEMAQAFEGSPGGVPVTVAFAGSQRLAAQIVSGAPTDVFASADAEQMAEVMDAGIVASGPVVFTHNRLTIVVEQGNPLGVRSLADLARDDLVVVLPAPEVPAGRYARAALDAAGVTPSPASLESDVKGVVSKVALGEADAGIVYVSDADAAADRVDAVPLLDVEVVAEYPIAVLDGAPPAAHTFVEFVLSEQGAGILAGHGFMAP